MTIVEIRAAINFGKEAIEGYKAEGKEVPSFVYDRMFELYEELAQKLSDGE